MSTTTETTIDTLPMSSTGQSVPMKIDAESGNLVQAAMNAIKTAKPAAINVAASYYEWKEGQPIYFVVVGYREMPNSETGELVKTVMFATPEIDAKGNIATDSDGNIETATHIAAQSQLVGTLLELGASAGSAFFVTKTGEKKAKVGKMMTFDIRIAQF